MSSISSGTPLFIVSSNAEKADPITRKLIRSHVMRGKKKQKGRLDKDRRTARSKARAGIDPAARVNLEEVVEMYTSRMPGRVGSDLSFIEFADEMEQSILLSMVKVSTVAMKVIYPLLAAIGFQADHKERLYPIARDAVALHITAFSVEGFIDRVLRGRHKMVNVAAMLHFQKGLRLLRERLLGDDDENKISDGTMSVVLKLASAAHFEGDYGAAKHHMEGLRNMVDLRGGLGVFRGKQLHVEMLRCDLGIALLNGSCPLFFCQPWEPPTTYPEALLPGPEDGSFAQDNIELQNMDGELARAWLVMKRFCLLVDLGTQTQRLMRPELIHDAMSAVMYRLLSMRFAIGSIDETVRHGLLAFCHHVFLQWQDIKLPCRRFLAAYRNCILSVESIDGVSSQLMLWLLMVGAISVFDVSDEAWLRESFRGHVDKCHVKTWREMQRMLKSVMWVALLDEHPGKHIYNLLSAEMTS
ncbi:hypothetical protein B0T10DRAFT_102124 [Thelonectria olida]|uniref:Tachykinin family protein n=1 Tax=Thelonectria olida TaxID=1576542 RepID=A0A9P9AUU8_9HYPO|nr:hypothetical protein B0T10DRAFT_102124 [Thelonectria olida]